MTSMRFKARSILAFSALMRLLELLRLPSARGAGARARGRGERHGIGGRVDGDDVLEDAVAGGAGEDVFFDAGFGGAAVDVRGDTVVAKDVSALPIYILLFQSQK